MRWVLYRQTNAPEIFGSISAICENTGLKPDNLYYQFLSMKRVEFENENFRIIKCKVKRASSKV